MEQDPTTVLRRRLIFKAFYIWCHRRTTTGALGDCRVLLCHRWPYQGRSSSRGPCGWIFHLAFAFDADSPEGRTAAFLSPSPPPRSLLG